MKILIVEDSKTLRVMMERYIASAGHDAILAENGETAVQVVETESVDMVIMDVEMPGLDGYETTRLIRENLGDEWIPIIFVTGHYQDANFEQGIDAGGDDYIPKPISETILRAKIRAMERIAAMRKQLSDLNAELTHLSQHDSLTGLYNRRVFKDLATQAWSQCARSGDPLTLLLLDIDHFKAYNDYYGHVEGDECISRVAQKLNDSLRRPGDVVARYGGEEFICLLPNTNLSSAQLIAESLRKAIHDLRIEHAASTTDRYVTISVGGNVVQFTTGITLAEQLNLTDKALYDSKNGGRNRVTISEFEDLNTVLLIDDDESQAALLCDFLAGHCKLSHLKSLHEAKASNFGTLDLIILNADSDNLREAYLEFQKSFNLSLIPLLILHRSDDSSANEIASQLHATDTLKSPLSKHVLITKINSILSAG